MTTVSLVSIALGLLCALIVLADVGSSKMMPIMKIVWPVTALYAGPIGLVSYWLLGKPSKQRSIYASATVAATHCGSGCTLGDIATAAAVLVFPLLNQGVGFEWSLAFVLAFAIGIIFQYFTIAPMRHLGIVEGLKAALKADALSLIAWQVGMYAWMTVATFVIFRHPLPKSDPRYWFMMQIAMLAGFATSYPVNIWLVSRGFKERM